jgi:phosphotransacetylase
MPGKNDEVKSLVSLAKFLRSSSQEERVAPPLKRLQFQKRGRPKALSTKKVIDEHHRALGNVLREIAEISIRNPRIKSRRRIAELLESRPRYKHLSPRTVRRDVTAAIVWTIDALKCTPADCWPELFGVQPPSAMTKQVLLEKSLEWLRKELLARKR